MHHRQLDIGAAGVHGEPRASRNVADVISTWNVWSESPNRFYVFTKRVDTKRAALASIKLSHGFCTKFAWFRRKQ